MFLGFLRSPVNFHAADGSGYKFMADSILKVLHMPGSFDAANLSLCYQHMVSASLQTLVVFPPFLQPFANTIAFMLHAFCGEDFRHGAEKFVLLFMQVDKINRSGIPPPVLK